MRIAVPTEIKNNENRVALTPGGADALVRAGHEVLVEAGAGDGSRIADADYTAAGARIVDTAAEAWGEAEILLKVKEPIAAEYGFLRPDLTLFTYLHLAADRPLTEALLAAGTTAIAYETVQLPDGSLPLLTPMSQIAGRLSVSVGAYHLMHSQGGRGTLLGGVPGVPRSHVVVIGGGVAGENAVANALGLGARVTVFDVDARRLGELEARYGNGLTTQVSTPLAITEAVASADLVVGSVLIPGSAAPKLVTDEMVRGMRAGSVLVDIAIDQGGCFEGSRPTTHDEPTFPVHDSLFYCVANMPGAVPETATRALTNATLPYVQRLAAGRWDETLSRGVNVRAGEIVLPALQ
ncbi:MAG TPA: alanine dehydrogenase [Microbacterium sp.]|nr:alanine dehydrogenase [Microbacterium sp.]